MPLPQYLIDNHQRIIDASDQQIALWNNSYEGLKESHLVVREIYALFPDRNMQRSDVIKLLRDNEYRGFIAAMMWGGINATRPKKDGARPDLPRLLDCGKQMVEHRISCAKQMIHEGRLLDAFLEFLNGNNSLPGVGHAYFTKLFFYLGQILDDLTLVPLIYDKWTAFAHCALRIQLLTEGQTLSYRGLGTDSNNRLYIKLPTGISLANLYIQYVCDFADWTRELNKLCPERPITVGKLEEFVFGQSLRSNNNPRNPRVNLQEIVLAHFGSVNQEKSVIRHRANSTNSQSLRKRTGLAKYQPLDDFLSKKSESGEMEVRLSLEEINDILLETGGLPTNAYGTKSGFWRNKQETYHRQKRAWLNNGYHAEVLGVQNGRPTEIMFRK